MSATVRMDRDFGEQEAALRFLLERIDYERARTMPYDPHHLGLARMRQLLERLGSPERGMPIVHVAGTKGKGSTSAMIAAVLTAAGYRTGLFTSPHLDRVEERMAVDGRPCTVDELVNLVRLVRPAVEAMDREEGAGARVREESSGVRGQGAGAVNPEAIQDPECQIQDPRPTYFEITTAAALLGFARAKVDAAVLEVGLGGRFDATNVCTPRISVITSISFDHTRQLGNTLEAIAAEKAGIIKPSVPVVSGVVGPEPRAVIRRTCHERGCRLIELGTDFHFEYAPPRHLERAPSCGQFSFRLQVPTPHLPHPSSYALSLPGRHQAANAAVALATVSELRQAGWDLPDAAVRHALATLRWPARVEVVARRPTVVLDAAHNVASVTALVRTLDESFSAARRLLVFAGTEDKDLRGMLGLLLDKFDEVYFTRYLNNPRAVPPEQLEALAAELTGRRWPVYPEPADAWEAAVRSVGPEDLVCVTGSFFIASEIRRQLEARPFPGAVDRCDRADVMRHDPRKPNDESNFKT